MEFHESGWVHYHAIFLTSRFLPKELLAELWGLGWVKVQRITNEDFQYLLKYVTKAGDLPDWVKQRKRLRVFQSTKGFLKPLEVKRPAKPESPLEEPRRRASYTMDERFWRWACMGVIRQNGKARPGRFRVGEHLEFVCHALAGKIDGLEFQGAPIHWLTRRVNENVVYPADEVARIFFLVFSCFNRTESVKESDLTQDDRLICLEQSFSHPLENGVAFEKSLWTCSDHWADARMQV